MTTYNEFFILDMQGATDVFRKFEKAAVDAENTLGAMADIAANMVEAEDSLFMSQGRRGGGSWAPIKFDTEFRKGSSIILVDTGRLYESLTKIGSPDQILVIRPTEVEFGTNVPYANIHQTGAPRRNIPKRPIIRFTAGDRQRWVDILEKHLMRAFRR